MYIECVPLRAMLHFTIHPPDVHTVVPYSSPGVLLIVAMLLALCS